MLSRFKATPSRHLSLRCVRPQYPTDCRLVHPLHLHQLATGRTAGEQAPSLGLLFVAEGCTFPLVSGVEPHAAECVAAHVVPLRELVRRSAGLVVLDQELDDRAMQRAVLGERAVVDLSCRLACRGQEFG